jgi:hypothetical protein
VTSSEAKNLEAISRAIDHHNSSCPWPAVAVRMNPYEVERLGWDTIRGLPVEPDPAIGTGRFHIVCARERDEFEEEEIVEAVAGDVVAVPISPADPERGAVGTSRGLG